MPLAVGAVAEQASLLRTALGLERFGVVRAPSALPLSCLLSLDRAGCAAGPAAIWPMFMLLHYSESPTRELLLIAY